MICSKKIVQRNTYLEIGMLFLFLGRSPVLWLFEGYMPLCRVRIIVILKIFAEHQIHKKISLFLNFKTILNRDDDANISIQIHKSIIFLKNTAVM